MFSAEGWADTEGAPSKVPKTRPDLHDDPESLLTDRAIHELRRGRAISVDHLLVAAVEILSPSLAERLRALDPQSVSLLLTRERAAAMGWPTEGPEQDLAIPLSPKLDWQTIRVLAGVGVNPLEAARSGSTGTPRAADVTAALALALSKQARLIPALLAVPTPTQGPPPSVLAVSSRQLSSLLDSAPVALSRISEARVPLAAHEDCRLVLFRDARVEGDHVAVVIGDPDPSQPVRVRVHSACLTGDLFGSLRCDCGDQLRGAVDRIVRGGSGVLLYLAQEGRGIGLANKLRAYALQDTGLDTFDADMHLGFRSDERDFRVAVAMLDDLGITQVRLLTNNADKARALADAGISVAGRETLSGSLNPHNAGYLRAKSERAGHVCAATEPPDS